MESRFSDGTLKLYYNGYRENEASGKKEPMVLILEVKEDTLMIAYTIPYVKP
jgi:hypothetical protein